MDLMDLTKLEKGWKEYAQHKDTYHAKDGNTVAAADITNICKILADGIREKEKIPIAINALIDSAVELKTGSNRPKAVMAGSFDPFTNGHLDIIRQASSMFSEIHVLIAINLDKGRKYNSSDMLQAMDAALNRIGISNCIIKKYMGMTAKYCMDNGIRYSIRGLRNSTDYAYEENMANVNSLICPMLNTVYIRSRMNALSSSAVKELLLYGEDVSEYVPKEVLQIIR